MTARSLLPPGKSVLERGLEASIDRTIDVVAVGELWNPETCPAEVLPWLAWGLAIDRWNADWTEAEKRAAIADAIRFQRIKGTRASIDEVIESFHPLLECVEWFEANPHATPHSFEIRAPIGGPGIGVPSGFLTADVAAAIVRDVTAVKPVRSHFTFVQSLGARAATRLRNGAMIAGYSRFEANAAGDTDARWLDYLQTEDGEPILTESGEFIGAA